MNPILYETTDTTNLGLGVLSDTISCKVTEQRNGSYELEMSYPISGVHFADIDLRLFILAKPNYTDDPQLFRIYRITKPLNGICTIYAQHLTYDLSGYVIPNGLSADTLTSACVLLTTYAGDFTINSTRTGEAPFRTAAPASVRSWFGGKSGSIIDVYGGEWHFDNFTCTLESNRGTNRGVTIRYGKNLTALTQEQASDNLYSAVQCYYTDNDGNVTTGSEVSTGITLDTDKTLVVDTSQDFGEDIPTAEELDEYAARYIDNHNLITPTENITLDFVQLKGLSERVDLCDTVSINYEKLGISVTAKCIETEWDCLKERYTKCVFGTARHTLADTIGNITKTQDSDLDFIRGAIAQTTSFLEQTITNVSQQITGNQGGYIVMRDADNDGHPDELLIMDSEDIATAVNVWRFNQSGLGHSSTGYNGTYDLAMTADGQIVGSFISAGSITTSQLSADLNLLISGNNSAIQLLNGQVEVLIGDVGNYNQVFHFTEDGLDITNANSRIYSHIGAETYQFRDSLNDDVEVFEIDADGTTGLRADVTGQIGIGKGTVANYKEQWALRKGAYITDGNPAIVGRAIVGQAVVGQDTDKYDMQIVWIGG